MRIELFGNKGLVSSAQVSLSSAGLHLWVNMAKRNAYAFPRGASLNFIAQTRNTLTPLHDTWVVQDPDVSPGEADEAGEVEVVIVSESYEDGQLLKSMLRFQRQEKDHFTAVYLPYSTFEGNKILATFSAQAS